MRPSKKSKILEIEKSSSHDARSNGSSILSRVYAWNLSWFENMAMGKILQSGQVDGNMLI